MLALLSGCATTKEPRGVREYRQITAESLTAIQAVLHSLDQVNAERDHCGPRTLAAFSHDVQQLQIHTIRLRARARTILERGDAYFSNWTESIATLKDPQVREQAERHRPQLEESFAKIKLSSKQAGATFDAFLSGLREVRVKLEASPEALKTGSAPDLMTRTRESGLSLVQQLNLINDELTSFAALLTPAK